MERLLLLAIVMMAGTLLVATSSDADAQSQRDPDGQPSLDELLDLGGQPEPTEPDASHDPAVETERPAADPDALDVSEQTERLLSGQEASDVLEQALVEMTEVSQRLGRRFDPGLETQRMQEAILDKLNQVIEAAKQQQMQGGGGGSGSGGEASQRRSMSGSQIAGQQSGQAQSGGQQGGAEGSSAHAGGASPGQVRDGGEDRPLESLRSEWGGLPPRLRDELSEGLSERFSPVYRDLTEAYYRRLAEEP